jgi:ribosomal protein S18 acetylase RimI-like enzyme
MKPPAAVLFGWERAASAALQFRRMTDADLAFIARLYASTRIEELAIVPWSEQQKAAFLDMQFRAQHSDYQRRYQNADWLVITRKGEDIGRLYIERTRSDHHIIDIALLPGHRRQGFGSALLCDLLDEAAAAGKPVTIYVEKHNPAMRLYRRMGFETEKDQGVYELMRWTG